MRSLKVKSETSVNAGMSGLHGSLTSIHAFASEQQTPVLQSTMKLLLQT